MSYPILNLTAAEPDNSPKLRNRRYVVLYVQGKGEVVICLEMLGGFRHVSQRRVYLAQNQSGAHYSIPGVSPRRMRPGGRNVRFKFLNCRVGDLRPQLAVALQILLIVLRLGGGSKIVFDFAPPTD